MLRSAASPGSVGFGRLGGGVSGLLMYTASGRPPYQSADVSPVSTNTKGAAAAPFCVLPAYDQAYLIFPSLNSTCFFATGSYFFILSFSVIVREFFLVT